MSELEELIEQRKEISRRIKELQEQELGYEDAKYFMRHYTGHKADDYCIAIKCRNRNGYSTWKTITAEMDKAHAIGRLKKQIQDAQGLLKLLEGSK